MLYIFDANIIDFIFAQKITNARRREPIMRYLFFLCIVICPGFLQAQDTLPNISVKNINNNILVSWTNPFTSLTNIKIQRSYDSLRNFSTIGSVLNVFNKTNGFVDAKPAYNNMFYRVFLTFEGGSYLFSPSYRPVLDTTSSTNIAERPANVNTWFVPSKRVFTGKDNNVVIALPDALEKKYSIKFYEENGIPVFEINKVTEPYLTVEKVNFVHSGLFIFEIYSGDLLVEKHKLYIPKDGKSISSQFEQGKGK